MGLAMSEEWEAFNRRRQEDDAARAQRDRDAAEQMNKNIQSSHAAMTGSWNPNSDNEQATNLYNNLSALRPASAPPPSPPASPSYVFSPPPPAYSPPAYKPPEQTPPAVPFTHTRPPASPPAPPSRPRAVPPARTQQQRPQPRAAIAERERREEPARHKRRLSGVGGFLFGLLIIGGIGFAVLRFLPGEIVPSAPQSAANFVVEPFAPQSPLTARSERVVIRFGPGQSNATLMTATPGEELPIIGRVRAADGVWFALNLPNGRAGYIAERVTMPLAAWSAPAVSEASPGESATAANALAVAATASAPVDDIVRDPVWLRTPPPQVLERYYPRNALQRGIAGAAVLRCRVQVNGYLSCAVQSETPAGQGFGAAALRFSAEFQASSRAADGSFTVGRYVDLPIRFEVAQ